jgi:hypothetical protein
MNNYVSFITDEDFERCVSNLYDSYVAAHQDIDVRKIYSNQLDVFKLTFDKIFGNLTDEELLEREVNRQIDKSITNAIGTFHEEILGCIKGYVRGNLDGWDIKSENNTIFADIKNKHNTMNSGDQELVYQNLQRFADENEDSTCYWVQINAKKSFNKQWKGNFRNRKYDHPSVRKISGDKFYELLSGVNEAMCEIYKALPKVITAVLQKRGITTNLQSQVTAIQALTSKAKASNRSLLDQLAADNLSHYSGFNEL